MYIRIKVQPRASKNLIDGVRGGALKVRLTAPPVEGEANRAAIEYLSSELGIRKACLSIDTGVKSRNKRVRVEGISREDLEELLLKKIPPG